MTRRALVWACSLVLCASAGAQAKLLGVGLSAFAGVNIPIAQDDAGSGSVFGLRAPLQVISPLRVEPWFALAKNGDYTLGASYSPSPTVDGGEITSFGLNALLGSPLTGPGFNIAVVGGLGSHKLEREGEDSESRVGFNLGLDLGVSLRTLPLSLSARAEGVVIPLDGGGSRKNAFITGALTYKFGI